MTIAGLPNSYSERVLNDEEDFGKYIFMTKNYGNWSTAAFPPKYVLIALQIASSDTFTGDPMVLHFRQVLAAKGITFEPYFTNFGFIRNPDNDEPFGLPIGIGESIVDRSLDLTCAACHSGLLPNGEYKLGMPNTKLNLGAFFLALDEVLGLGFTSQQRAVLATWGPGRVDDLTGKNDEGRNIPSDIPAHWGDLAQWDLFEYGGETRNLLERNNLVYFLVGVDKDEYGILPPVEEVEALTKFVKSIEPPINPDTDVEAAKRGEKVFNNSGCIKCHNGPDYMNNNFIVPLSDKDRIPGEDSQFRNGSIATDQLRNCFGRDKCGGEALPKLLASGVELVATDGYKVAPLSGIWATAPYLHNGSVPTLRDLLEPAEERPKVFSIDGSIFDTTFEISFTGLGGNGNQGHEFGIDLSDGEKDDLVEFLKSL